MVKKPDSILLVIVGVLIILGLVILASVSAPYSQKKFGNTYYFFQHQLLFALLPGLILGFFAYRMKLEYLKKWAPILILLNLLLLAAVFLPVIGAGAKGASRWIDLRFISFQPSEFLKLTFILYLAAWLSGRSEKTGPKDFNRTFLAFLIVVAIIAGLLICQPDISTLGIIAVVGLIIYFLFDTPLWHNFLLIGGGLTALLALVKLAPYRASRIAVFLNPDFDPMGASYQAKQALISVGSGGVGGVGLGMSAQKFGFLPEAVSDSIFAVFSEETGFIGGAILILLFLIFFWRGATIIKESQNKFSQFLALGITAWLVIQAFFNIGSMSGILPLMGIPLPFISYGGSALITELVGIGILLNISKNN